MSQLTWGVEEVHAAINNFLRPLLKAGGFHLQYEIHSGGVDNQLITPDFTVNFTGRDVELLLEQRAELLLALEHLTLEVLRVPHGERYRLIFDADDYRLLRIEELRLSAEAAAERVKRTGLPFKFSPMTSRERRVIHLALRDDPEVETVSEGVAPDRQTVIYSVKAKR
jgi:spoIIIJ-associated protein